MDPLHKVSHDIRHLVFQHFSAREVLEFSKISKEWHQAIGSERCMKLIKISLKFWLNSAGTKQEQSEEKIKVMQNSVRSYYNIAIDCRFNRDLSLELWKWLKFSASKISELSIKSIKLESAMPLSLPNLQVLKLTYVPTAVRNILINSSSSLKKLKLKLESPLKWIETSSRSDEESLTCIRNCMEKNHKLQELELHGSVQYRSFFDGNISKVVSFQLESLIIKSRMRLALISEENERNLIEFLKTQKSSLKSFFIDVCRQSVIQHAFNNMPVLASLHIDVMIMNEYKVRDLHLNLNENIIDLKIPYVTRHQDIKEFLAVTPNLTSLFVAHLSHETMQSIAWNLKNLITLKYRYDEIDCEDFYDTLKYSSPDVNQEIEMIVDYEYS